MKRMLMTYSSAYGEPMCEDFLTKYKDALVFDKKRKSIYTQELEFGYVGNNVSNIDVDDTIITLSTKDGVSTIGSRQKIAITDAIAIYGTNKYLDNDGLISESTTITVSEIRITTNMLMHADDIKHAIIKAFLIGAGDIISNPKATVSFVPNKDMRTNGSGIGYYKLTPVSSIQVTTSMDLIISIQDEYLAETAQATTYTLHIHAVPYVYIGTTTNNDINNISSSLLSSMTAYLVPDNFITAGTSSSNQVLCTNGTGRYVVIAVPKPDSYTNAACHAAVINDAVIKEMNGAKAIGDYIYSVAKTDNWNNSYVYFKYFPNGIGVIENQYMTGSSAPNAANGNRVITNISLDDDNKIWTYTYYDQTVTNTSSNTSQASISNNQHYISGVKLTETNLGITLSYTYSNFTYASNDAYGLIKIAETGTTYTTADTVSYAYNALVDVDVAGGILGYVYAQTTDYRVRQTESTAGAHYLLGKTSANAGAETNPVIFSQQAYIYNNSTAANCYLYGKNVATEHYQFTHIGTGAPTNAFWGGNLA